MNKLFQWAVIGAGPAGIAAIGKLLDQNIAPDDILWIDPYFNAGDLGRLWKNVSSNTSVARFTDFLNASPSFCYDQSEIDFSLNHQAPENTCVLKDVVAPLQWVTQRLLKKVESLKAMVTNLTLTERVWVLNTDIKTVRAKNVIIATGAVATSLQYTSGAVIPFDKAIDKEVLTETIKKDTCVAVFGSSHSAMIILKNLVDLNVKKIINFYRSPSRYAIDMGDWILFDNTGLKGATAAWTRQFIDGVMPSNLCRYTISEANIAQYLPQCDHIIYAVGFKRRQTIAIGQGEYTEYNPHSGILGPGLFGLGIAYPQIKPDPFGSLEYQVGLWKFMVYLENVLPTWLQYSS